MQGAAGREVSTLSDGQGIGNERVGFRIKSAAQRASEDTAEGGSSIRAARGLGTQEEAFKAYLASKQG